jgi:tRNA-dihydrouridine synthase
MLTDLVKGMGRGRLSVKIRLGFDDPQEFPDILDVLGRHALAHVTIHGRTRPQRYRGQASWQHIALAASALPFPVIASGDVVDDKSLRERLTLAPGIKGVMIGRGALRNPWIFNDLQRSQDTVVTGTLLSESLLVHALLQEVWLLAPGELINLVNLGLLQECDGKSFETLREKRVMLEHCLASLSQDPKVSSQVLGRSKMLWNYLRSSLPSNFFAPELLRSRSVADLCQGIMDRTDKDAPIVLTHRPDLDWIYAGGKDEGCSST